MLPKHTFDFFEVVEEPNANCLFRGAFLVVAERFLGMVTLFVVLGQMQPVLSS